MSPKKMIGLSFAAAAGRGEKWISIYFAAAAAKGYEVFEKPAGRVH